MLTLIVVFAAVALVVAAGEAVRGQCRRMLDRPLLLQVGTPAAELAGDASPARAVAAA
ncbi:MAG TPA: hypothetical protein VIG48_03230 [Jatrophihabitans sp.]|jgi:hypothetical protein